MIYDKRIEKILVYEKTRFMIAFELPKQEQVWEWIATLTRIVYKQAYKDGFNAYAKTAEKNFGLALKTYKKEKQKTKYLSESREMSLEDTVNYLKKSIEQHHR